jgi:hypothetical protein
VAEHGDVPTGWLIEFANIGTNQSGTVFAVCVG